MAPGWISFASRFDLGEVCLLLSECVGNFVFPIVVSCSPTWMATFGAHGFLTTTASVYFGIQFVHT